MKLAQARPFTFTSTGDRYGWTESDNGRAHLTLFIENGRVKDVPGGAQWLTGLRQIAEVHDGDFRLTANQNLIIANVPKEKRQAIEALVAEHGLTTGASALRRNAMACVALPTCGLALAESERYLPELVTALEQRLAAHGLAEDDIVIRMTGCPNGCARPYVAEIGLVGKGPGRYNLYLGPPSTARGFPSSTPTISTMARSSRTSIRSSPLIRVSAGTANASAIMSSARALSPRP